MALRLDETNSIYKMYKNTIFFSLQEKRVISKENGKSVHKPMIVARPTGRKRLDFRSFCQRVAKGTSFTSHEVAAVLNYATEIAKDVVAEGDIVEFGDLGTLSPTFRSKAVPVGETFRAQEHILAPKVRFRPNQKYFSLPTAYYEQVKTKSDLAKEEATQPPKPTNQSEEGEYL